MICSPLLAKQYFPRHWRPAFTDWETRGRLCFFSWSTITAQEENVPRVHPFTSRIQVHVRGQGFITCNRDWWEGVWGEVICLKKVQQSILNQSPPPPYQKFLDPPLYWQGIRWDGCICRLSYLGINMQQHETVLDFEPVRNGSRAQMSYSLAWQVCVRWC